MALKIRYSEKELVYVSIVHISVYFHLCHFASPSPALCVYTCPNLYLHFCVYPFVYVCVAIYPVWPWHAVILRKTDWDSEALLRTKNIHLLQFLCVCVCVCVCARAHRSLTDSIISMHDLAKGFKHTHARAGSLNSADAAFCLQHFPWQQNPINTLT